MPAFILCTLVIAALSFAPVRLELRFQYAGRLQVEPRITLLGIPLPYRRKSESKGRSTRRAKPPASGSVLTAVFRRMVKHRGLISRFLHLERLQLRALISFSSAAATALTTGAVSGLLALLPPAWQQQADIVILPDFFTGRSRVQGECMFMAHLGIMMLSAAAILVSLWLEEHRVKRSERPLRSV